MGLLALKIIILNNKGFSTIQFVHSSKIFDIDGILKNAATYTFFLSTASTKINARPGLGNQCSM